MSNLRLLAQDFEYSASRVAGEIMVNKMWPFYLGDISFYMREDFLAGVQVLEITASNLPAHTFETNIKLISMLDPEQVAFDIGTAAGEFFASIREPIPDHVDIVLGEN